MMVRIAWAVNGASRLACTAPSVLGRISESTRISSVTTTLPTVSQAAPKIFWIIAPTPAAPKVCETVLRVRIAASGRSTESFMPVSITPQRCPSSAMTRTWLRGSERNPASSSEHRKLTSRASPR